MYLTKNHCSKSYFVCSTFLFGFNGLILLAFGLWFLYDPMQNYALNIIDYSEDDPLLKFGTYGMLAIAFFTFFTAFVGCIGSLKSERCLISAFIVFALLTSLCKWFVASMALIYKNKFFGNQMTIYLTNISHTRYYRDKWVHPIMDTVQFYQQCCGGKGPKDYLNSFWYLTNTERGTRSFVPQSCCKQSQKGSARLQDPIDPMCTTYQYFTKAFNDSVNIKGCGILTKNWVYNQVHIFVAVSIGTSVIDLVSAVSGITYINQIFNYSFVSQ